MAFKKLTTHNPDLNRLQANVAQALNELRTPLQNSNVVSVVLFASQDNIVDHGLERIPEGFIVVFLNTQSTIWNTPSEQLNGQPSTATQINLRTSGTCSAKFIFF